MSNNIFYKALAAVSTVGIVVIAGIQVTTALKKGNTAEDQLAKTMVEIKNARKDALSEVKSIRSEVLKQLDTVRSNSLNELKTDRANALNEVKTARTAALKELKAAGGNSDGGVLLVLRYGGTSTKGNSRALQAIRVSDMDECQLMGAQWTASEFVKNEYQKIDIFGFSCLES